MGAPIPSYPAASQSVGGSQGGCNTCGMTASPAISYGPILSAQPSMDSYASQSYATPSAAVATQREDIVDCGPISSYKVVMVPEYFTETRAVPKTEYQDEVRYRTRTIQRQVPVQVQDFRSQTVMVKKTETKTVEYNVLVPETNEKTVEVVDTVPVWNEVPETYTVRVPQLVDVPEEYTVRTPKLRDEEFTYTVYVPQTQTQTKVQTVTNAVPVTKSRTIQVTRPTTRMKTVTKDYGHWETRVEEVAMPATSVGAISMGGCATSMTYGGMSSGMSYGMNYGASNQSCGACGGCGRVYSTCGTRYRTAHACGSCGGCGSVRSSCGGCGSSVCGGGCASSSVAGVNYSACNNTANPSFTMGSVVSAPASIPVPQTVSRRVWVPNVVTEEVAVVENVLENQEITYTAFEQQTEQIPYECTYVVYAPEERTGARQVVEYVEETRTRNRKVVEYNEETRTRNRKELTYKQETRVQTVPYVTYKTEPRTKEVSYEISVPETKIEPITTTRYETVSEDVVEEYTVRVPVSTFEEVQVQASRMVPKLVPVTIYPCSSANMSATPGVSAGSSSIGSANCNGCGTIMSSPVVNGCGNCN